MALQNSGAISLSDIQDEYGGSNPIGLSEYYDKGDAPSSGAIDLAADFYGTSNTIPVNFLVVAGAGGNGQAAGGAGGYRSSHNSETSGGGCAAESALQLVPGTQYTVTIGAGSTGGNVGGNSVVSGSGITTITSLGGGNADTTGGSGAGEGSTYPGGATSCQGYRGGAHASYSNFRAGGGGGGAKTVGGDGIALNHGSGRGGHGGEGQTTTISGSSGTTAGTHAFAGGGGGCALNYPYPGRPGGSGHSGGGDGKTGGTGHHATANTGSSGGGGNASGNGGSGIVWLRIPTANYTDTHTGSPAESTSGDYNILKFTSSGSYTAQDKLWHILQKLKVELLPR